MRFHGPQAQPKTRLKRLRKNGKQGSEFEGNGEQQGLKPSFILQQLRHD